jgi:hypothetical protein
MDEQVILTTTERGEGTIFWDGILQIAKLSYSQPQQCYILEFIDDPLDWGSSSMLSEDAAKYLALAYASELRAIKSRRH